MFVYVDESGHTGKNIFDVAQPFFYYTCAMSQNDIDIVARKKFEKICNKLDVVELHSYKLGKHKIESILPDLQSIIKKANIRFCFSIIDKKWFALCKFFDAIFDSGENIAVPWHVYNAPPLRHAMLFKLGPITSPQNIRDFYRAISQTNVDIARKIMVDVLTDIYPRISNLPDARSQEIISDALDWSIKHPAEFDLNFRTKKSSYSNLPTLPAFIMLCKKIVEQSKHWNSKIKEIKHDRQEQLFGMLEKNFLLMFDREFSSLKFMGQDMSIGGLKGADFKAINAVDSYGIQLVDVVQWCFKNWRENENFRTGIMDNFMKRVFTNTNDIFEISDTKSEEIASQCLENENLSPERYKKARELINASEIRRKEAMQNFENKK